MDIELCNRIRLQNLYEVGIQSPSELHAKTMIPLRTISRNLAKIRQGLGPERKPGSERKVKLQWVDRLRIAQIANKNKKSSAKKIAAKAHKAGSPPVHLTTIQWYLKPIVSLLIRILYCWYFQDQILKLLKLLKLNKTFNAV